MKQVYIPKSVCNCGSYTNVNELTTAVLVRSPLVLTGTLLLSSDKLFYWCLDKNSAINKEDIKTLLHPLSHCRMVVSPCLFVLFMYNFKGFYNLITRNVEYTIYKLCNNMLGFKYKIHTHLWPNVLLLSTDNAIVQLG